MASKRRIRVDAGWVNVKRLPRGPNDRALCRQCGQEVPGGRATFCGAPCVHEWKLRSDSGYVRVCLFRRDHGVCALCAIDTVEQVRQIGLAHDVPNWVQYGAHKPGAPLLRSYDALRLRLRELRIPWHRWSSNSRHRGIWDADHVVPVVEGGGECGLDNYRTLCLVCHADETARLRQRRAGHPVSYELF